ncbi:MAG: FHA domain-containing protein, partial [Propionicimonas sp.]
AQPEPEVPAAPVPEAPAPTPVVRPVVEWVAELWIDPDWYAAQGSTDPMPSAGLPDIAPLLKDSNLIGRVSHSRGIFPDVDCELDNGCSRRHAVLTTDGTRWWIEDLNSANGTFVGSATGPLPAMPIPKGRVELVPGQRIYVGAWTRIVIRPATDDEKVAFAGS